MPRLPYSNSSNPEPFELLYQAFRPAITGVVAVRSRQGPGCNIIRPYNNCVRLGRQYLVGPESDRYSSCVTSERKYDLIVSPLEIRNIKNKRKKLFA